jgi:hypothetical protein
MADWPKDGLRNSNLILLKTLAFSNWIVMVSRS